MIRSFIRLGSFLCWAGRGTADLDAFGAEAGGWLPVLPEVHLPRLTGGLLVEVVKRLPLPWYVKLSGVLALVEELGVAGRVFWMLFLRRASRLSVFGLMLVCTSWRIGFDPGFRSLSIVRGEGWCKSSVEVWCITAHDIEEVLSGAVQHHVWPCPLWAWRGQH